MGIHIVVGTPLNIKSEQTNEMQNFWLASEDMVAQYRYKNCYLVIRTYSYMDNLA